ncbi:ABC transporter permease [Corynebacterium choanae]|nr:ABC transporter permease [Corynebacterium choanae]
MWLTIVGGVLVTLVVLMALVATVATPYDPVHAIAEDRLQGPSWTHLFGTDQFGRDTLSRIMAGAKISLTVGALAVTIGAVVGVPLGVGAAMLGGRIDAVIARTVDVVMAFPALLLAIVAGAAFGSSTTTATLAIGVAAIPGFARIARAGTLTVKTFDYIAAARTSNVSPITIAITHVIPNIAGLIIVQATVGFSLAILAEAGLSFLGLGTPPPHASWGRMLADSQGFLGSHPILALWPGLFIAITVLGFNLLGDGLRDHADPRTRMA